MPPNKLKTSYPKLPADERRRRKREAIFSVVIILTVILLTLIENRVIRFGADIPISNTILMFTLININLLLLILLLFIVFRNLVKLLYDRKRKVMGARLRTRLVVAFISLTLLPTIVLFFFSISFITNSVEFWFNVPIEQALKNSLNVGRLVYRQTQDRSQFFLERVAYQVEKKNLIEPRRQNALLKYIQIVQREFNIDGVEVYNANADRLAIAVGEKLESKPPAGIAADNLQQALTSSSYTVSNADPGGELIRVVATVPFHCAPADVIGFVALTTWVSPELGRDLASISRGFEEYQQIKLLKQPIQSSYYITLSIVALLVLFCAIWFGFYLAKSITIPIMELAEGTRKVAEGDMGFSIPPVGDDEIGSLVESFNSMTRDLRTGRNQIQQTTQMLRDRNAEIEERRRYMEIVLKNISAGVISLSATGFVTTINTAAEQMLKISASDVLKRNYKTLLHGEHLEKAQAILAKLEQSATDTIRTPLKAVIAGQPRSFMMHFNTLRDDSGRHIGVVMVFDDLTELEKAQRMAAWREVARRIAHEVKNPLTPIGLSAQRLKRKYSKQIAEPVFDECTRMIIDHVDLIRNLVNEFSAFARFPSANPKPNDLVPIIDETVALYREGHPNVEFCIDAPANMPMLNLDRHQIKQMMINLVDNAIAAMRQQGRIDISLSIDPQTQTARLEVADDGPGINDNEKNRLFEPYFSTKRSGMGLGLTIVSTIVSDHNGCIHIKDNTPRGARFIIELPA